MPEQVNYRRREPKQELKALLALVIALILVLGGAWWLTSRRAAAPPGEDKAKPRPDDPIIIEVNGEAIRKSEFEVAIASAPAGMQEQLRTEYARKEIGEELVKMKLLEQEARRMGLDEDPKVRGRLSMMEANFLATAALQKLMQNVKPPTLEELYDRNRKRFETARVKAIVIPYEGSAAQPREGKPLPEPQARAKADQIVQRLRRGEDFGAIARAESADNVGGEFGEVSRGTLPASIDDAVFNLKIGEISEPLKSQFGFHIFKMEEKKTRSFQEIRPVLQKEARNFHVNAILEDLRKQAKVEFKSPFFPSQKPETRSQKMR